MSEQGIGRDPDRPNPFAGNHDTTYFPVPFFLDPRGFGLAVDTRVLALDNSDPACAAATTVQVGDPNALEVIESVEVLRGGGPDDLIEVTVALAEAMCELAGIDADPGSVLPSGAAEPVWDAMIRAQGGDPSAPLPTSDATFEVAATRGGVVSHLDALDLGRACVRLGAGRALQDDHLDLGAGIEIVAPVGTTVDVGDPVLRVHGAAERFGDARVLLEGAIEIGDRAVARPPVVIERR